MVKQIQRLYIKCPKSHKIIIGNNIMIQAWVCEIPEPRLHYFSNACLFL